MPKGPKGQKRPADVISNAVAVMKIATGEADEPTPDERRSAAARLGSLGGQARAKSVGKRRRAEIAKKAARARWGD